MKIRLKCEPSCSLRTDDPSWPLKMGPIGCPETSVQNYHSTLRNIPEERRYHLHRGGSLKSDMAKLIVAFRNFANALKGVVSISSITDWSSKRKRNVFSVRWELMFCVRYAQASVAPAFYFRTQKRTCSCCRWIWYIWTPACCLRRSQYATRRSCDRPDVNYFCHSSQSSEQMLILYTESTVHC
jgi:hypothetical protein